MCRNTFLNFLIIDFFTGKGLEVSGTFSRKNAVIYMDMTFSNKAMQPLSGFGIQFNKNSFGLAPAQPLNVPAIPPNQACAYIWTLRKLSPGFIAISQFFTSLRHIN